MKRSPKQLLLPILGLCLLMYACTKTDFSYIEKQVNATEKFFVLPANTSKTVQRVAEELKRQNNLTGFIKEFAAKQGFAVWDKAVLVNTPVSQASIFGSEASVTEEADTLVLIPLVKENKDYVNSFIAAKVSSIVLIKFYEGGKYEEKPFTENFNSADTVTAEKYALQLILLDNYIFGRTKYKLTDPRLFSNISPLQENTSERILEIHQIVPVGESNLYSTSIVTICVFNHHCTLVPGYCTATHCDGCIQCLSSVCIDFEVQTWYDEWGEGGGGGGGGGGEGGGGTTGWGNGTEDPCAGNGVIIINGKPACEGGDDGPLGWVPLPWEDDSEPTAEPIDSMLARYFKSIKPRVDSLMAKSLDSNWEYSMILVKHDTSIYLKNEKTDHDSLSCGTNFSTNTDEVLLGDLHIHPSASINPKDRSAPAGSDVKFLKQKLRKNYVQFVECGNKTFAMVIEDSTKAKAFLDSITRLDLDVQLFTKGQTVSGWYSDWQNATEVILANVLGSASLHGIGFYNSSDADRQKWIKINP